MTTPVVKPPEATKPPEAPKPRVRKVEISFNGKPEYKVEVPSDLNLHHAWQRFNDEHGFVSHKKEAFPSSFLGELVNKYSCTKLEADQETHERENFNIS